MELFIDNTGPPYSIIAIQYLNISQNMHYWCISMDKHCRKIASNEFLYIHESSRSFHIPYFIWCWKYYRYYAKSFSHTLPSLIYRWEAIQIESFGLNLTQRVKFPHDLQVNDFQFFGIYHIIAYIHIPVNRLLKTPFRRKTNVMIR